ncbi:MAG: prepilin-type N-terminal cleavage/methylation domain-containing protein [Kiritimatiellae bacterium]|nr:prepilin-type N-terminal cleavage/methylation domain-containing protein [Kiritimatiellia bacterium]
MATRRAGFTLIEMLSVMAVMVMLTTIVVASGFGMRRGASANAALQIPQNVMEYARQRACMDGRRTAVLFAPDEEGVFSASIFQAAGTVFSTSSQSIVDKFSDVALVDSGFNVLTVFNFNTGKTFTVGKISRSNSNTAQHRIDFEKEINNGGDASADGKGNKYYYSSTTIERSSDDPTAINSASWPSGSAYGFEIAERQTMPKNFSYAHKSGGEKKDDSFWFVFTPDGTTEKANSAVITVKETVGSGALSKGKDISL